MRRGPSCGDASLDRGPQTDVSEGAHSPGRAGTSLAPGIIRLALRAELPPHVFHPQPSRALIAVALIAAIIVTDIAILALEPVRTVAAPLSVLSGVLSASLFFLGHECVHGSIVQRRWLQDLLASAAFIIFVLSPTFWRTWHNNVHHLLTNSPEDDPDNFDGLESYHQSRLVRLLVALTPGTGRRRTLLYFAVWFTVHVQVVQWYQSHRCRGFTTLNRRRAAIETFVMAVFWLVLAWAIGIYGTLLVIVLPMIVANAIIMSYIATNHLLLPLNAGSNPLDDSMSVITHPLLNRIHFNFSYHVEHHFFPAIVFKICTAHPRQAPPGRARTAPSTWTFHCAAAADADAPNA